MALTNFQAGVCRIIAANRKAAGDSYIAGGSALNVLLDAPRLSHDIDLLPVDQAGKCMLSSNGTLVAGGIDDIRQVLNSKQCLWHSGSIGGIIPDVIRTA